MTTLATDRINELTAENEALKRALLGAIPWIGQNPEGPAWATPEAKKRNREMCDRAFDEAWDLFPNGSGELAVRRFSV